MQKNTPDKICLYVQNHSMCNLADAVSHQGNHVENMIHDTSQTNTNNNVSLFLAWLGTI
jgi:hypothetical protein